LKTLPNASLQRAIQRQVWRSKPSLWVRDKIEIELAHYRSRDDLEAWLNLQPFERHSWIRDQLSSGRLILDPNRSYQAEALDAMADPGQYALMWANGCAKTTTAALFVHWFLDNFSGGKILTTAATWNQLREQLWRKIRYWATQAKAPIVSNQVSIDKTQIDVGPDWAAFGRAFDREGSFEGVHAPYVLIVMDEAKAIEPAVFDEARRILRGNDDAKMWWVVLSSPGSPSGPFYDSVNGNQAHRWKTLRLSAYESSRISLEQIAQDEEDLGESSPLFVSMVQGQFPDAADDSLIPLSWVQAAVNREVATERGTSAACDVARFGMDFTVLVRIDGRKARIIDSYAGKDLMSTAGRVTRLSKEVDTIAVDDAGLGGGVTDRCREQGVRNLKAINAGAKALHANEFADLGSEMAWNLRKAFEETHNNRDDSRVGISIPDDKKLIHQLSARKYDFRSDGRIKVESKADMRKRGEGSPDLVDALLMAWWIRGRKNLNERVREINRKAVHKGFGYTVATMKF
jgi:phage terminase large subunit